MKILLKPIFLLLLVLKTKPLETNLFANNPLTKNPNMLNLNRRVVFMEPKHYQSKEAPIKTVNQRKISDILADIIPKSLNPHGSTIPPIKTFQINREPLLIPLNLISNQANVNNEPQLNASNNSEKNLNNLSQKIPFKKALRIKKKNKKLKNLPKLSNAGSTFSEKQPTQLKKFKKLPKYQIKTDQPLMKDQYQSLNKEDMNKPFLFPKLGHTKSTLRKMIMNENPLKFMAHGKLGIDDLMNKKVDPKKAKKLLDFRKELYKRMEEHRSQKLVEDIQKDQTEDCLKF